MLDIPLALGGDLNGLARNGNAALLSDSDAAGAEDDSGHQRRQLRKVAAVQRKFHHAPGFNHRSHRCVFRSQQRAGGRDLDDFRPLAYLKMKIEPSLLLQLDGDASHHLSLESRR